MTQAVSLHLMEDHVGAYIHLQPMEHPTLEQDNPQRKLSLGGSCTEVGFLAGAAFHGGPMLKQSVPERLYPVEKTHME